MDSINQNNRKSQSTWSPMKLKTLLSRNRTDLALLVGNGINRYGASRGANSWDQLLSALARSYINPRHKSIPTGISLTEFYDVLELAQERVPRDLSLQKQFCALMASWKPLDQHFVIANWASRNKVPVLTTNFENTLGEAASCTFRRPSANGFTAFYPWSTYFGIEDVVDPCSQFAIWHINGMQKYSQSIRLGLSHYMGSVGRARSWLHNGSQRLFGSGDREHWAGSTTWLQVFFHKPLVILGLGLTETEVFLRWLMIERAKYFKKFPHLRKPAWYVHVQTEHDEGKALFLKAVGFEPLAVTSYDEIYSKKTWALK